MNEPFDRKVLESLESFKELQGMFTVFVRKNPVYTFHYDSIVTWFEKKASLCSNGTQSPSKSVIIRKEDEVVCKKSSQQSA